MTDRELYLLYLFFSMLQEYGVVKINEDDVKALESKLITGKPGEELYIKFTPLGDKEALYSWHMLPKKEVDSAVGNSTEPNTQVP